MKRIYLMTSLAVFALAFLTVLIGCEKVGDTDPTSTVPDKKGSFNVGDAHTFMSR